MMKQGLDEMFKAVSSNDSGYDGRFYVGVHSTAGVD
jgi:methylphosphotriester-DNA--protein-cysteine methyltransferase